jgi:membrane-associated protein
MTCGLPARIVDTHTMMEALTWLLETIRNPGELIELGGYPGLALIVFLETGAMVFFLPGDSLLVTAGLYSANGTLNVWLLNLILIPCAIIGDTTSYWIGKKIGPRIFNRPRSRFFNPAHIHAAHRFYEKHGGKAIIIARFMPLVRTFVPVVAGVAGMSYPRFLLYNVVGGVAWVTSMTFIGYFLGQIPFFKDHIEKVIIAVVFLSILPGIIEFARAKLGPRNPPPPAVQSASSNDG